MLRLLVPAALALAVLIARDEPVRAIPLQAGVTSSTPAAAPATYSVADCAACHEKEVKSHTASRMGRTLDCAACHGDVAGHLASVTESGEPGPIVSFKLSAKDASARCLTCHDSGSQAHWEGGPHQRRGLTCASCHSMHSYASERHQLKTAQDAATCYTCHSSIRSKEMRVSHHPVREGLMNCASCHDPHDGSRQHLVSADSVNEKCLSCHTEKRGPFLWEHAPVQESCLNCHDPHGSNHEKLLVAKQPYLCQRCHLNTRHPGSLYDGRNSVGGPSLSNRAIEHACKNCHQNVHGGNAPSGPYLGR
jgi:DmsE family decaheme c-type cytochrome